MPTVAESLDVRVSFDPDHEDMTAEIHFGGRCLALVSQDQGGPDRLTIEFFPADVDGAWRLSLAEVEAAAAYARQCLAALRETRPAVALAHG